MFPANQQKKGKKKCSHLLNSLKCRADVPSENHRGDNSQESDSFYFWGAAERIPWSTAEEEEEGDTPGRRGTVEHSEAPQS